MNKTILLQARAVSKRYDAAQALFEANLEVYAGEVHALIGSNGAGKSTLIKIVTGAVVPDTGEVLLNGKPIPHGDPKAALDAGISCIYQESNLVPNLSVMDNILLGRQPTRTMGVLDRRAQRAQVVALLKKHDLNLDPDAVVQSLSTVQQKEVEIAKALSLNSKVVLMDEPTAWLSQVEVEKLFRSIRKLTADGAGVLYISHVLDEIFSIADRVTVIRDGKVVLSMPIRETTKSALVQAMLGRQLSSEVTTLQETKAKKLLGPVAIECRHLSRVGLFQDINLQVHRGEIVCITGLIGAKRTELVRTLFGAEPPDSGQVLIENRPVHIRRPVDAVRHGVGLIPEDRRRDGLLLNLSMNENLVLGFLPSVTRLGLLAPDLFKQMGQRQVDRLGIVPPRLEIPTRHLSGGNQQKVLIGRWLAGNSGILILDEPTVGVDVGAKADIYKLLHDLADAGAAILLVSSDMEEVMTVAHRILVMASGSLVASFEKGETTQEQILSAASGEVVK